MMRLEVDRDPRCCRCCGSHVTPEFRRSQRDDNDVAHRCPECDTLERIAKGSAAGLSVTHPDPLEEYPRTFARGGH
ncbi:DUF7563 family protein [Natrialbaceae archaeon AArc-T1-2]|uniref:DUF7563 family protein n=1 Tax=Natrialbaceae archaeon AArc-T1-2 TaxID=3053904 RepID=UPI00255AD14D|nr:hypothetical protein [Natrialbaceae archaeon AArc-T1-2]WIV67950.1 hypothetical protein QQ977_04245 [Natrialbaceae archaeon AArc-T1-2]